MSTDHSKRISEILHELKDRLETVNNENRHINYLWSCLLLEDPKTITQVIEKTKTKIKPEPKPSNRYKLLYDDQLPKHAKDLEAVLPELFNKYPNGVTAKQIMDFLNANYWSVVGAASLLHRKGIALWGYFPDYKGGKMLLPLNSLFFDKKDDVSTDDLSESETAYFQVLKTFATDAVVTLSQAQIHKLSGVSGKKPHFKTFNALASKGYVKFLDRGNKSTPATYKVLKDG